VARRKERDGAAARGASRAPGRPGASRAARARRGAGRVRRRTSVGSRAPRGLGRGDREAPRIAVRTSPLAELAQDEMRGIAGARRRRLHRSAGKARRPRRAARRLLRGG
jgi:hypothetical protein